MLLLVVTVLKIGDLGGVVGDFNLRFVSFLVALAHLGLEELLQVILLLHLLLSAVNLVSLVLADVVADKSTPKLILLSFYGVGRAACSNSTRVPKLR